MAYEPKDMTGTLFKNDKREKDTHPQATGSAIIGGVAYWVSAWTKEGSKGKFQSLAFTPKQERAAEIRRAEPQRHVERTSYGDPASDLDGDSIPF